MLSNEKGFEKETTESRCFAEAVSHHVHDHETFENCKLLLDVKQLQYFMTPAASRARLFSPLMQISNHNYSFS